jgi:hypothetical protein
MPEFAKKLRLPLLFTSKMAAWYKSPEIFPHYTTFTGQDEGEV